MYKIKTIGKKRGQKTEAIYKNGVFFVNGVETKLYDYEIYAEHPIAGTYYPGAKTKENVLNNLENHFFDDTPEIETTGEFEEIPYVEGRIY